MGDIYAIIIPVSIIVVVLKVTLICCRIWFYQKRREERLRIIQHNRRVVCRPAVARVVSVRQMQGPGGIAQQTSYAIDQPGCPTQHLTRTIVVRPASRRPNDPNLPPSYDQAVTGADRSVRVDDSKKQPHINGAPSAPAPAPAADLPHMPPPRHGAAAPPAYQPTPSAPYLDNFHYSDRQRLLA